MTENEYKKIIQYAEASRLSPANWMRKKVFTGKFPPLKLSPLDSAIYHELNKIGVNINQATHKINQGVLPDGYAAYLVILSSLLEKICKLLSQ